MNTWDRETIRYNMLRRTEPRKLKCIHRDVNSVMHFAIPPGLVTLPTEDQHRAFQPKCELSDGDIEYARKCYPSRAAMDSEALDPFVSHQLDLENGEQKEFRIDVPRRRKYVIETQGFSDISLTLYEACKNNNNRLFLAAETRARRYN
jgi:hypothetical protein